MKFFIVVLIAMATSVAVASKRDVIYVGKISATEPDTIRMISGKSEVEIPRKFAAKNYLVGEKAKILVPADSLDQVKEYKIFKKKN